MSLQMIPRAQCRKCDSRNLSREVETRDIVCMSCGCRWFTMDSPAATREEIERIRTGLDRIKTVNPSPRLV
jgi:predicted nucleic-acid-binding Zn-ribbon protein